MEQTPVVLVADDDPGILKLVRSQLQEDGFHVITAQSGEEALKVAEEQRPDLIVLDLMLPGISGYEVMRHLQEHSHTPVILLTGRGQESDKVRGLELGADDYVVKPFSPEELTARVRAVLRRARRPVDAAGACLRLRGIEIDLERRLVMRDGELVSLTRTEWDLLQLLAENPGKVMLSAEILGKVWGPEYREDLQYLRVWVSRLRRKLEPDWSDDSMIRTFPGMGYMLEAPEASPALSG
jgi:DNA-binding response OmpR family regulator